MTYMGRLSQLTPEQYERMRATYALPFEPSTYWAAPGVMAPGHPQYVPPTDITTVAVPQAKPPINWLTVAIVGIGVVAAGSALWYFFAGGKRGAKRRRR